MVICDSHKITTVILFHASTFILVAIRSNKYNVYPHIFVYTASLLDGAGFNSCGNCVNSLKTHLFYTTLRRSSLSVTQNGNELEISARTLWNIDDGIFSITFTWKLWKSLNSTVKRMKVFLWGAFHFPHFGGSHNPRIHISIQRNAPETISIVNINTFIYNHIYIFSRIVPFVSAYCS